MPRVSIVTAAYNPGPCLRQTVETVLKQTYGDWDWWIVDDGSKEDLSWVASRDSRIRYVRQQNAGPSAARNRGILESSGELIAFLDADDLWHPEKLERQTTHLQTHPEAGLVYTNFDYVSEDNTHSGGGFGKAISGYDELLLGSVVLTSTVMLRRSCLSAVGLFDAGIRGPEDYDFFLRLSRGHRYDFLDSVLTSYRQAGGSLSARHDAMFPQVMEIFRRNIAWARRHGREMAVANAREGMRRKRISYACTRLERARTDFRDHHYGSALTGLAAAARHDQSLAWQSLSAWLRARLTVKH